MKKISWKTFFVTLSVLALAWPWTTLAGSTGDDLEEIECPEEAECEEMECLEGMECINTTVSGGGSEGSISISAGPGSWDIATLAHVCTPDMICAEWFSAAGDDHPMDGDLCCIFELDLFSGDYDNCQVLISKRPRGDETAGGNPNDPENYNGQGGNGAAL